MKDMTLKEYDAMVRRLEEYAKTSPRAYKLRVAALAVACYGYVWVVCVGVLLGSLLLCLLAITRPVLFLKLGIYVGLPAIALVWGVGRAMLVRLDPPDGEPLTPEQAPRLFAMIEEVREELDAKPIHAVLVTSEFNAAAYQHPLFGMFGFYRNYLILGLPLMMSLSSSELRSVIGHELGHMAGDHSRFGNWIYKQRISLRRLRAQLSDEASWLFRPLYDRFIPYFNAYSFALARANEYEADASAAKVTDAEVASRALMRVHADGAWFDETFWGDLRERNRLEETPPRALFVEMHAAVTSPRDVTAQLRQARKRKSTFSDTHPSLTERLEALGHADLSEIDPPADVAAEALLFPETLDALTREFSGQWLQHNADAWRHNHARDAAIAERLGEIEAPRAAPADDLAEGEGEVVGEERAPAEELERGDAFERAVLVLQRHGGEEARPLFERFIERFPDDAEAQLILGQIKIMMQDATGEENLDRAVALDAHSMSTAADVAIAFWMSHNEHDRAQRWIDRANRYGDALKKAAYERDHIFKGNTFTPPEVDPEVLAALADFLSIHAKVKRAWLARKELVFFPEDQLYVLCVEFKRTLGLARNEDEALGAIAHDVEFPHDMRLLNVSTIEFRWLRKAAEELPGALVYEA
jgi:Zn-dependent protease with chaperone function